MTRSDLEDRDGHRQWSQSEKEQILNDARATLARRDDQEIPRRDGNLDEQRTSFSDQERDKILKTARAYVAGYDDEKFEIGDDGDRKQRAFSPGEKAEILRTARDTFRRHAAGMITKVTMNDAPEAHTPRQSGRWRRRAQARTIEQDEPPRDDELYAASRSYDPVRRSRLDGRPPDDEPTPPPRGLDIAPFTRADIEQRFQSERESMYSIIFESQGELGKAIDILGEGLADVREWQRKKEYEHVENLRAQAERLEAAMERLGRLLLERDRSQSSLIDLPNPLSRGNVN